MILSIDPGRDKIGVAIYDSEQKTVIDHQVVLTQDFLRKIMDWYRKYQISRVILGDGTLSKKFLKRLTEELPGCHIEMVNEAYSTLEARNLYYELNPPKGLKRLLPLGLQTPDRPVDDLVAIILLKRYLGDMPKICK